MISDPYAVLGVSKDAGQDEIKSAYRKMAKKYHPDLHPNDPKAADKMNEINEAYDILSHPDKLSKWQNARNYATGSYNAYGQNTSQSYGQDYRSFWQNYAGNQNSERQYKEYGSYQGNGWYSFEDFFDYFDFGSFGNYTQYARTDSINPKVEGSDSDIIKNVVNTINVGRYDDAIRLLCTIPNRERNGRWYYLYSLSMYGKRDEKAAASFMKEAVRMDENNILYRQLLNKFETESMYYQRSKSYFVSPFRRIGRILLFIIILQFIFRIIGMLMFPFWL